MDGGLDMIDFGTYNTIFKTKWINNYIQNANKL